MTGDCGPEDVDCREVLAEVYLYLDGELPTHDHVAVRRHLDACSPCLRKYGLEQDVKALVARCCGNDHAPEGLRHRVLARIRSVQVQIHTAELPAD